MTKHEAIKFAHVLLAIIWVGGGTLAAIFATRARKADDTHKKAMVHDLDFVASRVFSPAGVLTAAFGVWLVIDSDAFSFGDTWIVIGIGAVVVSAVLGMAVLAPLTKKLIGEFDAGSSGEATFGRILLISRIDLVVLLIAVWAMATRPG